MSTPEPTAAEWREALEAVMKAWDTPTEPGRIGFAALGCLRQAAEDRAAAREALEGGGGDGGARALQQILRLFPCGGVWFVALDDNPPRRVTIEVVWWDSAMQAPKPQPDKPAHAPLNLVWCPTCDGSGGTGALVAWCPAGNGTAVKGPVELRPEFCPTCGGTGIVSLDGETVRRVKVEVTP